MGDFHLQPLSWKITIEGLGVEKDRLHCISGKSEPLLNKLCGSALMPLSEIGSATVRNNSTTVSENPSLIFPSYWSMPMDFRAREISSSCFLAVR